MLKLAQAEIVGTLGHQLKEVCKPSSYQRDTHWNQRIFFHLCNVSIQNKPKPTLFATLHMLSKVVIA